MRISDWSSDVCSSDLSLEGAAVHIYRANRDMEDRFFVDAEGELLSIQQLGRLTLLTELGRIDIAPREVALVPRGVSFRILMPDGEARGYVAVNTDSRLRLHELRPPGSHGLTNQQDDRRYVQEYVMTF